MNDWFFQGTVDTDKALYLIEKEYALHPEIKLSTRRDYVEALAKVPSRKKEAVKLAQEYYDEILATGKNDDFALIYSLIIAGEDYHVRDSLRDAVAKKYPHGLMALTYKKLLLNYYSSYKPDTAIIIYDSIRKNFPSIGLDTEREIMGHLLTTYTNTFDCDNFDKTMALFLKKDTTERALYVTTKTYNSLAWNMFEAGKDLDRAKSYAEKSLAAHRQKDSLSYEYGQALDTYSAIVSKLGDKKAAIINQQKAMELTNCVNIGINQRLMEFLIEDSQFAEAKRRGEEFIADRSTNQKINELYKTAYIAVNGSESGFSETFARLEKKAKKRIYKPTEN